MAARWVLLAALACSSGFAAAGNFGVSPLRVTLTQASTIDSLTLRNEGDEPAVVQMEMMAWRQEGGQDVLEPTRDVLATPPIFTIPPKGTQIVRVGLRRAPDAQQELTYRMFLQEVPPPPRPDMQGLQVALRLSLPIFVKPAREAKPVLRWTAVAGAPGMTRLQLTNAGKAHVQVAQMKLSRNDGTALELEQGSVYVLAGESRSWNIRQDVAAGATLRLAAKSDAGDIDADVSVGPP